MNYLKKLGVSLAISLTTYIILLLLVSIFSYLNILKGNGIVIFKLIVPILSLFVGSISFGFKAIKKGWLEGLKFGLLSVILILIINLLFYRHFVIKNLIYYSILLISSILGSMVGIMKKSSK